MKLKHNNTHLYSYLIGSLLLASPLSSVYAAVVMPNLLLTPALRVDGPGRVLMVDGLDAGVTVNITALDGTLPLTRYDFGFVTGGSYNLITNQFGNNVGSFTFTGGTAVDFALRDRGADNNAGTADDVIYSISNAADYADQWYYAPIDASNSRNPVVTSPYYHTLALLWDLNLDGIADTGFDIGVSTPLLGTDGVAPSVTAVPLPAAIWLLGAGLLGMTGSVRRKKAG